MKNNPEYLNHTIVYIPGGSSPGMHIPQYATVLPAIKCVCLTVLDIRILNTLGTQQKAISYIQQCPATPLSFPQPIGF